MTDQIVFPVAPSSHGKSLQLKLQKMFEAASYGGSEGPPMIGVDYRDFAVNMVTQRSFSKNFLPIGVSWIDRVLIKEGFRLAFKDNMKRLLNTGEYFAIVGVRNGSIFIDRLPRDWVHQCVVYEKTGELLRLVYIEPVVVTQRMTHLSWRKVTWTPESILVEISFDDDPEEKESYRLTKSTLNPYGFVPVVPFKLGTEPRGIPIWKPAESIIGVIQDIINDIRLINAYNAAPTKWLKTDGEVHSIGETGFLQIGTGDDIGALVITIGESLFTELEYDMAVLSDLLGIPVTSLLAIGKHASGEAIEKRFDTLNRTAEGLQEYVGNQMQLMFRMMCAFISQGLVEVDLEDPNIKPLITSQVVLSTDTPEEQEFAEAVYISNLGTPVDLSAYEVPNVSWEPVEKINASELVQLSTAIITLKDNGLITEEEARKLVEMNVDSLIIANDMLYLDSVESSVEKLGVKIGISA